MADYRDKLHTARNFNNRDSSTTLDADKAKSKVVSALNIFGLLKQIDFLNDLPFFAAIGAAILKDVLDAFLTAYLPPLDFIAAIFASSFIGMMMFLSGAGEKRKMAQNAIKKIFTLLAGTTLEMIPLLDALPFETITILFIYGWTLFDRKNAEIESKITHVEV
jgi:hypothetical protein